MKIVSIIAKVIDKENTLDFPSSILQLSPSHSNPENQIPGIKIPAKPVTVEKKLKKAVTAGLVFFFFLVLIYYILFKNYKII